MTANEVLIIALIFLILLSGFFSGSETGMMVINRYRLRHMVRKKHRAATRVSRLLERPDRLLGVILIGNTFANIFASALATMLAVRFFGDIGVLFATILLTLVILIFAEITPKTFAASAPQRVAFFASLPLKIMLKIFYPMVWLVNSIANGLLALFKIKVKRQSLEHLTHEELRTVVHEAGGKISSGYQDMVLGVLDLGKVQVEDIMVPRNEIIGIDLDDDWEKILALLTASQHTRLLIYRESIDNIIGILHMRRALNLLTQNKLNKTSIEKIAQEVYFVPAGTSLNVQLLNFRKQKCRVGLVVDEYGDIQGLVTLDDILEEIVGEFTTDIAVAERNVRQQKDGSYLVDGVVNVRDLNRMLGWKLPTEGPKTLSGLIVEYLETIPEKGIGLRLGGYPIEVVEVKDNTVKLARVWPDLRNVHAPSP